MQVQTLKDVNTLFDYAQQVEPGLFNPPAITQQDTVGGSDWYYRYFEGSQTYAAVNVTGGEAFGETLVVGGVYVTGGAFGSGVVYIDTLANLLLQIP